MTEKLKEILRNASVEVDIQGYGVCDVIYSSDFERVSIEIAEKVLKPLIDEQVKKALEEIDTLEKKLINCGKQYRKWKNSYEEADKFIKNYIKENHDRSTEVFRKS